MQSPPLVQMSEILPLMQRLPPEGRPSEGVFWWIASLKYRRPRSIQAGLLIFQSSYLLPPWDWILFMPHSNGTGDETSTEPWDRWFLDTRPGNSELLDHSDQISDRFRMR